MKRFFSSKSKSSDVIIEIQGDTLSINHQIVVFPIELTKLESFFGVAQKTERGLIYWQELGIQTNPLSVKKISSLDFLTDYNPMEARSKTEQAPFFSGTILVDGTELQKQVFAPLKGRVYEVSQFTYSGMRNPCVISINYNQAYDPLHQEPLINRDTYVIKETGEENITFADFGFKLAVIQELMYVKELLLPKFNLEKFVEYYEARTITIKTEGFDPIPEAMQYFRDLPIPKGFATMVTELYQDGGNEIYSNILPFGEGWENYWDIKSAEDAVNFPNLKQMFLGYVQESAQESVLGELQKMGIDAKLI